MRWTIVSWWGRNGKIAKLQDLTETFDMGLYIDRLDKINMCARPRMIVGAANYLIRFENRVVGHQWLKRFLERNPEYHIRKQKPLAAERRHSHNAHDMSDYFEKVERSLGKKGSQSWMYGTWMRPASELAVENHS